MTPVSTDDTSAGGGGGPVRPRRHWVVVSGILLVKLALVALLLILPSGLAISLGAAHGVALLVLVGSVAVALVVRKLRGKTLWPQLPHRPHHGHGLVLPRGRRKASRTLKGKGDT